MLWQPRGAVGLWTSSRQTIGYIQADLLAALMPSLDIHSDVKPHTHIEKKQSIHTSPAQWVDTVIATLWKLIYIHMLSYLPSEGRR